MSTWRPIPKSPLWKRWLPRWLHGPVVLFFQLGGVGVIVVLGVCFSYFIATAKYDLDEVIELPNATLFYDRNGREMDVGGGAGRKLVKRGEIPDFLVEALGQHMTALSNCMTTVHLLRSQENHILLEEV